jgi:hypothetical protein
MRRSEFVWALGVDAPVRGEAPEGASLWRRRVNAQRLSGKAGGQGDVARQLGAGGAPRPRCKRAAGDMWAETDASRSQNELNVGDRVASVLGVRRAAPARGGGAARRGAA